MIPFVLLKWSFYSASIEHYPAESHIMNTVKIFILVLVVTWSSNKQFSETSKHNY